MLSYQKKVIFKYNFEELFQVNLFIYIESISPYLLDSFVRKRSLSMDFSLELKLKIMSLRYTNQCVKRSHHLKFFKKRLVCFKALPYFYATLVMVRFQPICSNY